MNSLTLSIVALAIASFAFGFVVGQAVMVL